MTEDSKKTDKELEEFLNGTSELSSLYREASNDVVPAHMDEVVLRLAREDVNQSRRKVLSPFSGNWKVPASLAAVLVLSVTVILRMENAGIDTVENEKASPAFIAIPQPASVPGDNAVETERRADEVDEIALPVIDRAVEDTQYPASDLLELPGLVVEEADSVTVEEAASFAGQLESTAAEGISGSAEPGDQFAPDTKMKPSAPARSVHRKKLEKPMLEIGKEKTVAPAPRQDRILRRELPPRESEEMEMEMDMVFERAIASSSYAQVRTPAEWLKDIKLLWLDDKKEQAKREFTNFHERYPDIGEEMLLENLGQDVFNAINSP